MNHKYRVPRTSRSLDYNPNPRDYGKSLTLREKLASLDFIERNVIWTAKLPGDAVPRSIETRTLDGNLILEGFGLEVAASALSLGVSAKLPRLSGYND